MRVSADPLTATDMHKPQPADWAEFRAGWRLLIAAMIGVGVGLPGLLYNSIGVFAPVIAKTFAWSYATVLGGLSVTTVALLVLGPFVGRAVDRHGARPLTAISLALLGFGYMALALTEGSVLRYYAIWLIISLIGMGATPVSFTRAISGAFLRHRGLALGIALAGTGLFVILVKPAAQAIMAAYGWRAGVVFVGLLPLVLGVPVVLWGLPTVYGTESRGLRRKLDPSIGGPEITLAQAVRTKPFWILATVFLAVSFASAAPLPNLENILRSLRLDHSDIVRLTSLVGITVILGRLLGGWLLDRLWAPAVGSVLFGVAGIASWMLSQPTLTFSSALSAVLMLGLAAGVELDLMSYLVARYFGVRSYGSIYGLLYGLFAVGGGVGPTLLARAYDSSHNYTGAMVVCAGLLFISMVILLGIGRYPLGPEIKRQQVR